jgi:hypothetical protein
VQIGTSTVIKKGARTIYLSEILKGDKILSVDGAYDYKTNVLSATNIQVYQDKSVFLTRNFQGTLKSISGTSLPVTAVINIDGINYDVYFANGSTVLNNAKAPTSLSRFVVGDTVRFNGTVREMNLSQIDATVFRDLNF